MFVANAAVQHSTTPFSSVQHPVRAKHHRWLWNRNRTETVRATNVWVHFTVQATIVWVHFTVQATIVWVHFTVQATSTLHGASIHRVGTLWCKGHCMGTLHSAVGHQTSHSLDFNCTGSCRNWSPAVAVPAWLERGQHDCGYRSHPAAAGGNGTQTCGVPFSPRDPSQSCSAFVCCVGRPQLGAQTTVTGVPGKKTGVSTDSTLGQLKPIDALLFWRLYHASSFGYQASWRHGSFTFCGVESFSLRWRTNNMSTPAPSSSCCVP